MLDYGCGRGKDADGHPTILITSLRCPDVIVCTYVLNVVVKKEQIAILKSISKKMSEDGRCFITVRRDITREGITNQENVKLPFPILKETKSYCIYAVTKELLMNFESRKEDIKEITRKVPQ